MTKKSRAPSVATAMAIFLLSAMGSPVANAGSAIWWEYTDSTRAFVLNYPPDGRVTHKQPRSVVIQNFESDDLGVGPKGRYYVEIEFVDPPVSCDDMIQHPTRTMIGKTHALISLAQYGGDAAGLFFILCAVRKYYRFSAVVSENDARGRIAKRILRSVRFLDE